MSDKFKTVTGAAGKIDIFAKCEEISRLTFQWSSPDGKYMPGYHAANAALESPSKGQKVKTVSFGPMISDGKIEIGITVWVVDVHTLTEE